VRLDSLTWEEVAETAAGSVLAVPVGSTEQHGPHLPLSTDTLIAGALCTRLARARPGVLVAPPVAYGSAGEHAAFPGTLSIGTAATEQLLVELGRSADAFAGVLFVSTHGGNAAAVAAAVRRLVSESRPARAWSPPPVGDPGDAHAGHTETSVLLALHPEVVRRAAAVAGPTTPLREILPVLRESGVAAVSRSGVLGDPAGASPVAGAAILDRWAEDLLAATEGWPGP
jgi:creatinine amidohydrolase